MPCWLYQCPGTLPEHHDRRRIRDTARNAVPRWRHPDGDGVFFAHTKLRGHRSTDLYAATDATDRHEHFLRIHSAGDRPAGTRFKRSKSRDAGSKRHPRNNQGCLHRTRIPRVSGFRSQRNCSDYPIRRKAKPDSNPDRCRGGRPYGHRAFTSKVDFSAHTRHNHTGGRPPVLFSSFHLKGDSV